MIRMKITHTNHLNFYVSSSFLFHLRTGLALSVLKMNISYLGLTALETISNGNVMIAINKDLCYTDNLNMSEIFDYPSKQLLRKGKNMDPAKCGKFSW